MSTQQAATPQQATGVQGIVLKTFIDTAQLTKDLAINPVNLDDAMIGQAALYMHYASLTIEARKQYERLKSTVAIIESKLYAEIRSRLISEGTKPTEGQITSATQTDSRWVGAQSKLIEAQGIWRMCEHAENAFGQRKDMVLELARDRRKDKEGEQRIMEFNQQKLNIIELIKSGKAGATS